jgi:MoxR-like ATPase
MPTAPALMVLPRSRHLIRQTTARLPARNLLNFCSLLVLEHLLVRSPPGLGKTKQAMEWATGRFREPQRVR